MYNMYFSLWGVDLARKNLLTRIRGNIPTRVYVPQKKIVVSPVQRIDLIFKQKGLYLLSHQKSYKF